MRAFDLKPFLFVCIMLATLGFAALQPATEEFQARLLGRDIHPGMRATKFIITIDGYTTPEEVYELAKTLSENGYEPFMAAFRALSKGYIRPIGGRGIKVNIHAAHSLPTEKGRKIMLFTQRQSWDPEAQQRTDQRFTFMVFELNLDKKGKGDGKIYEQANIRLTGQGMIEMESYNTAPLQLWGVTPRK